MSDIVRVEYENNIGLVVVNNPPVNTITAAVRDGLRAALAKIKERNGVQAVLLMCEGSTFFSGADVGEFDGPPKEAEYRDVFLQLENLEVPVVVAMHGTVMGGGLEIALAAHYRVSAPGTRLGLPEVSLGIIPGAGGTQRMPRLIGAKATLEMILGIAPVTAEQAVAMGFVDEILQGDLRAAALDYARQLVASGQGVRRTSERPVDPDTATPEIFAELEQLATKKHKGRQAPLTAIQAVKASVQLPFMDGLLEEERLVNEAKQTTESKALVHLFFAERETRKIPDLPKETSTRPIGKVGVIGAGTMGTGIAMCYANAGIPVVLIDVDPEGLERGLNNIGSIYASRVQRKRMTEDKKNQVMALITGGGNLEDTADCDLVIEAVYENMALKRNIFAQLDAITAPSTILATNTSTLDINEIASVVEQPGDVIGLHFFSPANVMPLLEVVRSDSTSAETIKTCMDMAKTIRKVPVLTRVCYGFIGNRMMEGYAREAERMVLEGATPKQVDTALENFGMAMGILAVFDMAGVDTGTKVHEANADKYPPDPTYYQADFALVEAGRLGQKNGKGYYRYEPGDRTRHEDEEAIAILRQRAEDLGIPQRKDHTEEEIVERCILPLINEGIQLLDEGIAIRAADVDVTWSAGYGFPRYRGGPLFYADTVGLKSIYEGMLKYREKFGPMHWQPAPLLEKLVKEGKRLADWEPK